MTGPEQARDLAKRMAKAFAGLPMPVVATALAEMVAIFAVLQGGDDEEKRHFLVGTVATAALDFAGALDVDLVAKSRHEAEEKRLADILANAGPKRASPWGEPR